MSKKLFINCQFAWSKKFFTLDKFVSTVSSVEDLTACKRVQRPADVDYLPTEVQKMVCKFARDSLPLTPWVQSTLPYDIFDHFSNPSFAMNQPTLGA